MAKDNIEIQLSAKSNEIRYVRLSKASEIYCDSWRTKTYLCMKCKSVVASKIDHTRWHQEQVDLMISIAYRTMTLDQVKVISYQPVEVNPLVKPDFG